MKSLLLGIGGALNSLKAALVSLGALGVFGIALLDAGFVPLPGGLDVVVMTLSHNNHAMAPLYVLAAVIGATLGCLVPYWVGLKTGEAALRKFSAEKRQRVERLVVRYDFWTMLICAAAPPGFPFKIFLVTAGMFRMNIPRFLIAIAIGRSVRFILEGWLAVSYGEQAMDIFKQHYPKIGLGVAAAVIVIFLINKLLSRRHNEEDIADGDLPLAK
ncbi:MAG: YqaA family protein [Blastocatellia bacterium]